MPSDSVGRLSEDDSCEHPTGRQRIVRSITISRRHLPRLIREEEPIPPAEDMPDLPRPRTRGECDVVPRPCPFVSCEYHLFLDVQTNGSIKTNFPDLEPGDLPPDGSCALDIADDGGATLERVGELMNFTRERTRQVEAVALAKVKRAYAARRLLDDAEPRAPSKRRLPVLHGAARHRHHFE